MADKAIKLITTESPNLISRTAQSLSEHSPQSGTWKLLSSYLQQTLPASCFEKSDDTLVVHHHTIDSSQHLFFRNGKSSYIIEEADSDDPEVLPTPRPAGFHDIRKLFHDIAIDFGNPLGRKLEDDFNDKDDYDY